MNKKAVFSRVAVATSEYTSFGVHGEIKFDLTLKKIKFSVSFMLLFTIIMLLPTLRLSRHQTNVFRVHFVSIWSCSACLGGLILGQKAVLYLKHEVK